MWQHWASKGYSQALLLVCLCISLFYHYLALFIPSNIVRAYYVIKTLESDFKKTYMTVAVSSLEVNNF